MEKIYYKVTDNNCKLYQDIDNFINYEQDLMKQRNEALKAKLPEYTYLYQQRGFNRLPNIIGVVFANQNDIDAKTWTTKQESSFMLSKPNRRSKSGKEMAKFLNSFKSTSCFDVDKLLGVTLDSFCGEFYTSNVFKKNDIILISIDSKNRQQFETNNQGYQEITNGEFVSYFKD